MDLHSVSESESRFRAYIDSIAGVVGHPARKRPLQDYCIGLMGPSERKSVEPIAAVTAPDRTSAQHQSLLHFVAESDWSDEDVLATVRHIVLPTFEAHGSVEAWIIDDTGFPKQGKHSVGVAAQYCGQLGREGNCQVAVSLSVANHHASLPIAYRLYLPRVWASDRKRRRKTGVPRTIRFMTKPQIALEQIKAALAAGIAPGVVLMDADYGRDGNLRGELRTLGLSYVAAIQSSPMVWSPGSGPKPGRRLPNTRSEDADLVSVKDIALALPKSAWKTIRWREGTAEWLSSRFARIRVRLARETEQWLLIEWPRDTKAPAKYWLSNLPQHIAFDKLVDIAKLRWRIERDYQELKQELGLGHYEGRGWRGFHHHATLCIAAYGFLISERETIPPSGPGSAAPFAHIAIPESYRPRGATAAPRATRAQFNSNHAPALGHCTRRTSAAMSLLRQTEIPAPKQVTQ
jgi:SRSO17 transposase